MTQVKIRPLAARRGRARGEGSLHLAVWRRLSHLARGAVGRAAAALVACSLSMAVGAVMVPAGAAAATPAGTATGMTKAATPPPPVTVATGRWAGPDRYATAAAISAAAFAPGVAAVFIASGNGYADAESAAPAAGRLGAPILTVPSVGGIPTIIAAELTRLKPKVIYVLGGIASVPPKTALALATFASTKTVMRLAGSDRYRTSAAIATKFFGSGVPVALIASGSNFPDALAAGPAAARAGGPVLLVPAGAVTLPAAIATALKALKPAAITVLGGTAITTPALAAAAADYATSKRPVRYAGPDRFDTAVAVSGLDRPKTGSTLLLATGLDFADALAAGPVAAVQGDDLLLTDGPNIPASVSGAIAALAPRKIIAIGGPSSVPDAVLASARSASQSQYLPQATFTAPTAPTFTTGTSMTVAFTMRAGLGTTIANATLVEQTASLSVAGTCDAVTWQPVDLGRVAANSPYTFSGLAVNTCYRFGVSAIDTDTASSTTYTAPVKLLSPWSGVMDLYRASAFVTQADSDWCVGASSLETVNLLTGASNTGLAAQQPIQAYAQDHSPYRYPGDAGSDPAGWAAAIDHFAGTIGYHDVNHTTFASALAAVALALRETGAPVGIAVARGTHAWVAVGFAAAADPLTDASTITGLYVTGPLYPTRQVDGYDPAPNTFISAATLRSFMTPYHEPRFPVVWEGDYVTIEP